MLRIKVYSLVAVLALVMGLSAVLGSGGQSAGAAGSRVGACVPPPANMVAWYALDETNTGSNLMEDLTGNYDGVYYNDPTINLGQYVLNSRKFNGVNQYGEASTGPDFGVGDFTIDAWINFTATDPQVLVDKRDATPVGYMLFINSGRLGVQIADSGGFTNYFMNSPQLINDGQWHFVAVVVQRTGQYTVKLWADSISQSYTNDPRTGNLNNANSLRLARNWPAVGNPDIYLNGSLDEVEFFNRALLDNELLAIRNAGTDGKCKGADTPTPTVTNTATNTTSNTPTNTPVNTPVATSTNTPTVPGSATNTPTIRPSATNSSTATRTAFPPGAPTKTPTPTGTGTPPTAIPTPAQCTTYGISVGTGTIVPATTLVPGSNCDDCTVEIDISELGFFFPFYDLYGSFGDGEAPSGPPIMRRMLMGSNGSIELVKDDGSIPSPTTAPGRANGAKSPYAPGINSCLPAPGISYSIFPHWDDLRTDCEGCGIFTNVSGDVGSRIFDIEWRANYYLCGGYVNVQVRLHETTGDFEVIYGQVDQSGSQTTVGVQRDPGQFTQYACNTSGSLTPGMALYFTRQGCGIATPTRTATVTGTPPTATATRTPVVACNPLPTATPCPIQFSDVPFGSTFYDNIRCLACRGIVNGYADGTFKPGNNVTRGQLSKIVSNSAGFNDPAGAQMFEDVPPGSTFYDFVQRLANRGYIGGYPCGGQGEPCIEPNNRPYFRPGSNATRGQISKIVSNAAGFSDPAGAQMFEDVPPGSTFYDFVQRLANRGYITGYPCGGPNEPCIEPNNRPYFRTNSFASRGQTSKIVANSFFPGCSTPGRAK